MKEYAGAPKSPQLRQRAKQLEAGAGAELRAEVRATTELFLRRHVPDSWDEFAQAMRTASVVYGSLSQQLNSLKRQLEF